MTAEGKLEQSMRDASDLSPAKLALLAKWARDGIDKPLEIVRNECSEEEPTLSFVQERQLFLELLDPGTAVNNLAIGLALEGALDSEALVRSANRVMERHELLRTYFAWSDGRVVPKVVAHVSIDLEVIDVPEGDAETLRLAEQEAGRAFELDRAPLLRARLFRKGPASRLLLIVVHHTIADGWSLGVLLRELFLHYRAIAAASSVELPPLSIQYRDYAAWQRRQVGAFEPQLRFWQERLRGELPVLDLPTDHPRGTRQTFNGAVHRRLIPADGVARAKELSRACGATPFMTFLAAYQALLHRFCREDDILVGTPIAGRTRAETQGLIGPFINTLVLRTDLSGNPTFRELVGRVRDVAFASYANQDAPFEKLVAVLRPQRDLSRTPIFQVMFNLQNAPLPDLDLPELRVQLVNIDRGAAQFDLSLIMSETADGMEAAFEYNCDLFEPATVERLGEAFELLLNAACAHPDERLSALPLMSDADRNHLVVTLNDTDADYPRSCLHQLIEAQVQRTPDRIAIRCDAIELSYLELDRSATSLAKQLQARGVGPNVVVGIRLDRSVDLLVALLAVHKAGGAYLPIDPELPDARMEHLLTDADAAMLLSEETLRAFRLSKPSGCGLVRTVGPGDLAYVIYTSGSTGRPKGVPVRHSALVNLLWAMRQQLGFRSEDRLLAVTSVSFDIAALELFMPLITGGTVVLATRAMTRERRRLQETIAVERVSVMQATPAMWRMLLQGGWVGQPGLVTLCGGEPLTPELAEQLLRVSKSLWNVYGPTETTIWSAGGQIRPRQGPVTIGRALANTQLYVLDSTLQPLPIGAIGELHIGGDGVASGYLNLPEITAERFVLAPPHLLRPNGARLFKSGDLARYRPDGSIEILGRLDEQLKLHGFRIEPGEIESALRSHPTISDAAVAERASPAGDKHLVAYIVADEPAPDPSSLRDFLRATLPSYMVPAVFVPLPALPLTIAGKIDRRALPTPLPAHVESVEQVPATKVEALLAGVYAQVLGLPSVGIHDNFFDLGGGSIQILEIIARAGDEGLTLPPELFFEHQTVAELAASLGERPALNGSEQ